MKYKEVDCVALIPIAISGPEVPALVQDPGGRQTSIMLRKDSEIMIASKCSIRFEPGTKALCVVLCIGERPSDRWSGKKRASRKRKGGDGRDGEGSVGGASGEGDTGEKGGPVRSAFFDVVLN